MDVWFLERWFAKNQSSRSNRKRINNLLKRQLEPDDNSGEGAGGRSPNRFRNTKHSTNMNNAKLGGKTKLEYTFTIGPQSKVER